MNEKVLRIAELVLEINAKTDYCAFFSFSGHIRCLNVYVSESKANYQNRLFKADFVSVSWEPKLDSIINELEGFLEEVVEEAI